MFVFLLSVNCNVCGLWHKLIISHYIYMCSLYILIKKFDLCCRSRQTQRKYKTRQEQVFWAYFGNFTVLYLVTYMRHLNWDGKQIVSKKELSLNNCKLTLGSVKVLAARFSLADLVFAIKLKQRSNENLLTKTSVYTNKNLLVLSMEYK